jgi:fatty-acyl-CoA synthase
MAGQDKETEATWRSLGVGVGDVGVVDADGWLTISGRSKEMIKTGGENVYPSEVECVLLRHPAVEYAVAYGVSDDTWGERVEAAIVRGGGEAVSAEELRSFCRTALAGYKIPKSFRWMDAVPMTAANKPDRRALEVSARAGAIRC